MSDQQQCPEWWCRKCREGGAGTPGYCPFCEGPVTGKKESPDSHLAANPSPKVSRNLTGSGEVSLPADLIDRAVKLVPASRAGIGSGRIVRLIVERAAPALVAFGREQEKARWEARIEQLAEEREFGTDPMDESLLLRSLLNEEGI